MKRSAADDLEMQRRIQEAIDCRNVVERGAASIPEEMHGAYGSAAGNNVLCTIVTRKAGDIIGACNKELANQMTKDG